MQTEVLATNDEASLRAYVAWVPMLPADNHDAAVGSSVLVPDERAVQFWDERGVLPPLFAPVLGLPDGWPAWDVYMAYAPGALWEAAPPRLAFWHHQLGDLTNAPRLDGRAFARQLRELLERRS